MAKDKILAKLEEHDRRFDDHDRRFDEYDKKFNNIDRKLSEHDKQFSEIREEISDFRGAVMEALDHLVVNSDRLDQERLFTVHRTDELEKDVRYLEQKTGFAREK